MCDDDDGGMDDPPEVLFLNKPSNIVELFCICLFWAFLLELEEKPLYFPTSLDCLCLLSWHLWPGLSRSAARNCPCPVW